MSVNVSVLIVNALPRAKAKWDQAIAQSAFALIIFRKGV